MANDFKRMWTKEEIEDTYTLEVDDFVNGVLEISREKAFEIGKYKRLKLVNGDDIEYVSLTHFEKIGENITNWFYSSERLYLEIIDESETIYSIKWNIVNYVTHDYFETLVSEVPTDVSIIEDQGKIELMLEHDGNVLAINDTPNQFLQRNLDKPAFRWNGTSSEPPLVDALNNIWGSVGKRLCFIVLENNSTFNTSRPRIWCVGEWDGQVFNITPLVPIPVTLDGNVSLCQYITITPLTANITLSYIEGFKFADGSYASGYNLGNVGVDHLRLF